MSCNLLKWDRPTLSWTIASTVPRTLDQCHTGTDVQHAEILAATVWSPKDLSPKSLAQYMQDTQGATVTQSFFADSADAYGLHRKCVYMREHQNAYRDACARAIIKKQGFPPPKKCPTFSPEMFWLNEEGIDPLWAPRADSHHTFSDLDEPPDPCPLCGSTARSCHGYAVCWRCWTLVAWRSWWKWRGDVGELPATLISAFWLGPWNVARLHYDPDLVIVLSYELLSRWSFGRSLLLATFEDACWFAAGAFLVPWTRRQARTVRTLQCFDIPILFAEEIPKATWEITDARLEMADALQNAETPMETKPRFRTWLRRALGLKGLRRLKHALKRKHPSLQWIWGTRLLMLAYDADAEGNKETETSIETLLANVCLASHRAPIVQSFVVQETTLHILQARGEAHDEANVPTLTDLHQWVRQLGHKYLLYIAASKSEALSRPNNANLDDSTSCILQSDGAWRAQTMLQETLGKWGFILPRNV